MISSLKFLPNPFRFLLVTEWVMLASCGSLAMVEAWQGQMIPVQHIMILVMLGLMGLFLPSGKLAVKVLYTALEQYSGQFSWRVAEKLSIGNCQNWLIKMRVPAKC